MAAFCRACYQCQRRVDDGVYRSVATAFPLEPGQSVQLRVHLDRLRPMRVDLGVVRWAQDGKAGIEFIRMAEADQIRLRFYVGHSEQRPQPRAKWDEAPLCVGF